MTVIDKILNEWAYRCSDGVVDFNNPQKFTLLEEILSEYDLDEKQARIIKNLFKKDKEQSQASLDNAEDFSNFIQTKYAVAGQTINGLDNLYNDIQSSSKKDELMNLIKNSGRTLFLCDGGDKELEFRLYSKYLKTNDVIMLHDYSHSEEEYNIIKEKINWPTNSESHYKNIERYLPELNLTTFMYDDFKQVLWGSFIKN